MCTVTLLPPLAGATSHRVSTLQGAGGAPGPGEGSRRMTCVAFRSPSVQPSHEQPGKEGIHPHAHMKPCGALYTHAHAHTHTLCSPEVVCVGDVTHHLARLQHQVPPSKHLPGTVAGQGRDRRHAGCGSGRLGQSSLPVCALSSDQQSSVNARCHHQMNTHLEPLGLVAHRLRRTDARLDGVHKLYVPHHAHL